MLEQTDSKNSAKHCLKMKKLQVIIFMVEKIERESERATNISGKMAKRQWQTLTHQLANRIKSFSLVYLIIALYRTERTLQMQNGLREQ